MEHCASAELSQRAQLQLGGGLHRHRAGLRRDQPAPQRSPDGDRRRGSADAARLAQPRVAGSPLPHDAIVGWLGGAGWAFLAAAVLYRPAKAVADSEVGERLDAES